ncbi:desmethyl-deoxy-podophyllotoxin synthase-like [Miscanthus floridulus]|uniref:desmethyl-deoxy-podophyllotoxin synthase-like n=1 Tax=Miscanthus floridulus TaxID=154761 RepID=UPI0034576947
MEQASHYLCLFLALLLPLLLLRLLRGRRHGDGSGVRLPPGPWRLPVIGSLHHLVGKPLVHRAFADLARRLDAPLMHLRLGEVPVLVATSRDAAREVLRTNDVTFATRPWSPTIRIMMEDGLGLVFAPYGDLWRQLRKICILELLSARRVQSFRHVREDEVARLVAAVASTPPGEPVNVSRRIAVLVADSAVRAMIGDRFSRRDEFLVSLEEGLKLVSGFNLGDLFPSSPFVNFLSGTARRAHANHRKNFELMECAIKQHEERRALAEANGAAVHEEEEDLVDVLLRIQKEGGLDMPLTMGMIKAVILDLFSAGSETSATTLQWAMAELMRNPDVMKKAQAELRDNLNGKPKVTEDDLVQMKYLKLIIKETLRLHPAAPLLLPREARESCKILGYDVPKGTTVLVNAWAIGRDPKYWDDAEEFKPERFECGTIDFKGMDFEYIPFGAGRRICPGMVFAQSNIELALAALLYHFDWKLEEGMKPSELDMIEDIGITVRKKNDLILHPIVRVPHK